MSEKEKEEMVTITRAEYKELIKASMELEKIKKKWFRKRVKPLFFIVKNLSKPVKKIIYINLTKPNIKKYGIGKKM